LFRTGGASFPQQRLYFWPELQGHWAFRGVNFGAAGADGVVLQNEPSALAEEGRSETCPTAVLQNEPVDRESCVFELVWSGIRSDSIFGGSGVVGAGLQNELSPDSR
jgi:hypothetical protein